MSGIKWVRCIRASRHLTVGRVYKVLDAAHRGFKVDSDNNGPLWFGVDLFDVEEGVFSCTQAPPCTAAIADDIQESSVPVPESIKDLVQYRYTPDVF